MIAWTIDWLSCTFPAVKHTVLLWIRLGELWGWQEMKPTPPRNGYQQAIKNTSGAVLQWSERADMGINLLCTGEVLSNLHRDCYDFHTRLISVLKTARTVSRLDIALDVRPGGIVADLYEECKANRHVTHARSWTLVASANGGQTLYIGSRDSERMMRIYDKGAEQGGEAGEYDRIELEVKGEAALRLAHALTEHDIDTTIKGWINDFCTFNTPRWQQIVGTEHAHYVASQRKKTYTRDWLLNDIAPIIVKLIRQGDLELWGDLTTSVNVSLRSERINNTRLKEEIDQIVDSLQRSE